MNEDEKNKKLKDFVLAIKANGNPNPMLMPFKPEIQAMTLCSKCDHRLTQVFGGHWIFVYSDRIKKRKIRYQQVAAMMAQGKDAAEICAVTGFAMSTLLKWVVPMVMKQKRGVDLSNTTFYGTKPKKAIKPGGEAWRKKLLK